MNPDCAEHVVVTKHDAEGRILEFIKSPIGLAVAESLKAKAYVERERKAKADALLDEKAAKAAREAANNSTRTVKPKRTIDEFIVEASLILSAMNACADALGAQVGKAVMVKWLEPHKDCAAGSRLEINTLQIDNAARAVLDQLCKQKTFAVRMPEAHDSFLKAFRAGADAALADFNERKAVRTEATVR